MDLVIDAYKRDVDRTLIRENLRLSPDERLRRFLSIHRFVLQLHGAAWRKPSPRPTSPSSSAS